MIISPKDAIVPIFEIFVLLYEELDFLLEKPIEMAKHKGGSGLAVICKVELIWVCLDDFVWMSRLSSLRSGVNEFESGRDGARQAGMPPR